MGDIRIKIECPNDKENRPSINIPPEEDALNTFFEVYKASITMSHGERKQVVEQPPVKIKIDDYQTDIQKKYFFLEWANCYWKKDKFKTRRLRKVTVQFLTVYFKIFPKLELLLFASLKTLLSWKVKETVARSISFRVT